jgi:hypothetical protein
MIRAASKLLPSGPKRARLRKTFADYAAIAVCPVLIILLVDSLVLFLLEIAYTGSHLGQLRWTLFWFVLAMVLVSRIAIEKGYAHAGVYGLGLAAATALMLSQFVAHNLGVWCLLGFIWWATNKLTWDCTVIDDEADASGEGLLQAAKLEPEKDSVLPARRSPLLSAGLRWWMPSALKRSAASTLPHAPGLWVIYFSIAALPIFGFGQGLIALQNVAVRQRAFLLLCAYLATALSLLLITSFLGLRRYLRQRRLEMPLALSATWITLGSLIAMAILVCCVFLPRPNADWSLAAKIAHLGDPSRKDLDQTVARAKRPARVPAIGTAERLGTPAPKGSEPATAGGASAEGESSPGGAGSDDVLRDKVLQKASDGVPSAVRPGTTGSLRVPFNVFRIAIYATLLLLGLFVAIKNKDRLLLGLSELRRALQTFLKKRVAPSQRGAPVGGPAPPNKLSLPFAAFSNPFASGEAMRLSLPDLIVRSFKGLEAWARERKCGRRPEQTPLEFAANLGEQAPDLALEAREVTRLYVQVAYASTVCLPACEELLEALWSKMTSVGTVN